MIRSSGIQYRVRVYSFGRARAGVTVVEVLVVLALVSLLFAIASPAVMDVRERSRNAVCATHLKDLGIAVHGYESQFAEFPVTPRELPRESDVRYRVSPLSIHARLLPFLDQQNLYKQLVHRDVVRFFADDSPISETNSTAISIPITMFACPSDGQTRSGTNYRLCVGTTPGIGHQTIGVPSPNAALAGMATRLGSRATNVTDGLSNTAFFCERLVGDREPRHYTPNRDVITNIAGRPPLPYLTPDDAARDCAMTVDRVTTHASFSGATWVFRSYATTLYNHVLTPNSSTPDCSGSEVGTEPGAFTARSNHAGGVNLLLADGSVRFVSNGIDVAIWRGLASVQGNEPIPDF